MKKLALFSLLLLTMVSCTFNEDEPDTYWKVVTVNIPATGWEYKNNDPNPYYTYTKSIPALTSYVFENGSVQAYFVDGGSDGVQISLPFTRYKQDIYHNLWSTTIDAEYSVGSMSFFVTHSDFATNDPPGNMTVRVVLMW